MPNAIARPPFTIQRICELCLDSQQNYAEIGKFLRALERSLLVTSSGDSFISVHTDTDNADLASASFLRDATTPLFSPITFLHEDPRSRSPSPMSISGVHVSLEEDGSTSGDVIGLVDELDIPEPGHLADRPRSLTRITTEHDISRARTSGLDQSDAIPTSALADNQNNMMNALKTELFGFAKDEDKEVEDMVLENKGTVENQ
jgi:serine/threonine-protein phosphatase 4 regulatory subunit 2